MTLPRKQLVAVEDPPQQDWSHEFDEDFKSACPYCCMLAIFDCARELVSSLTAVCNDLSARRLVLFIHER